MSPDLYLTCSLQGEPGLSGRAADGLYGVMAEETGASHLRLRRAWAINSWTLENHAAGRAMLASTAIKD